MNLFLNIQLTRDVANLMVLEWQYTINQYIIKAIWFRLSGHILTFHQDDKWEDCFCCAWLGHCWSESETERLLMSIHVIISVKYRVWSKYWFNGVVVWKGDGILLSILIYFYVLFLWLPLVPYAQRVTLSSVAEAPGSVFDRVELKHWRTSMLVISLWQLSRSKFPHTCQRFHSPQRPPPPSLRVFVSSLRVCVCSQLSL